MGRECEKRKRKKERKRERKKEEIHARARGVRRGVEGKTQSFSSTKHGKLFHPDLRRRGETVLLDLSCPVFLSPREARQMRELWYTRAYFHRGAGFRCISLGKRERRAYTSRICRSLINSWFCAALDHALTAASPLFNMWNYLWKRFKFDLKLKLELLGFGSWMDVEFSVVGTWSEITSINFND